MAAEIRQFRVERRILVDALGAQAKFEHRRDDPVEPAAQAARAGGHSGGALWVTADTTQLSPAS
jgi:hypothetical protein